MKHKIIIETTSLMTIRVLIIIYYLFMFTNYTLGVIVCFLQNVHSKYFTFYKKMLEL
mgnify:CR=1 FL=1